MTWNNPEAFLLFLPLFYCYVHSSFLTTGKKGAFFYSGLNLLLNQGFSLRVSFIFLPRLLKFLALAFVVFALARPHTAEDKEKQTQKGVDIMIVMDISLSMLAEDMGRTTRLEASKEVVQDFIEGRPNDRMGLIVFAGESFTRVPLTFDHELLNFNLSQVTTLSAMKGGTAIGVALSSAALRLQHSPVDNRVIIFLTDGENNAGFIDPGTALGIVVENKIKVYTIGLGQSGTFFVKQKVQDAGGRSFYRRIPINSRINKKLMKRISSETGGTFFMARNLVSLERVFRKIDELETYDIEIDQWTRYEEHFKSFLLIGAVVYFLSVILSLTVFFRGM